MDVSTFLEALEQSLLVVDPSIASTAEEDSSSTSSPLVGILRALRDAKAACNNSLWHEFGVALLQLFDANHEYNRPGAQSTAPFNILHSGPQSGSSVTCEPALDFHTYVLVPTRFSISASVYARLLKDILDTVAVAASEGTNDQRQSLLSRGGVFDTLIEGALSNLSAGKAADGAEGDEDGLKAIKCLQAQALLLAFVALNEQDPEGSPALLSAARGIILEISTHLQSTKAQDIDPTLQAFLGRARLYEAEAVKDFQAFYQHATKYVELSQRAGIRLSSTELAGIGFKSCIAGLASSSIHTQGELLNCKEMVSALADSGADSSWILSVVQLTHEGNLDKLRELYANAELKGQLESILPPTPSHSTSALELLHRKVQRIALVRSFCNRMDSPVATGDDGHLMTFQEIADECQCSATDGGVEKLVLSSVAHGLLRAKVDGLTEEVRVSWVMPRVLAVQEVEAVQHAVQSWSLRVGEAAQLLLANQPQQPTMAI